MGIQIALKHRTQYRYDKTIVLGPQVIQLRPVPHCKTAILSYSLDITPAEHLLNWRLDPNSNHQARLLFPQKTNEFVVEVNLVADLSPINPFDFFLEPGVESYPFSYSPDLARDLGPYLCTDLAEDLSGPRLLAFLENFATEKRGTNGTISLLLDLNRKVRDEIDYVTRLEPGIQSCEETLQLRSGSCRDSAWLLVQLLRNLGIAARFVSGYLIQLAPDETALEGSSGPEADSADLHAWAEAFLPGAGWIGLDPTSGMLAGEGHIPLVCTPDATKAAPIGGTMEPANVEFSYSLSVLRLNEAPRVTRPFSEKDWANVERVAHLVDADLEAQDVRLTMGGEPTFVGIDEPESAQWNIDALGPIKRTRGLDLIRSLSNRTAPGALLHFGQGKWYPGEPLPRWALSCYWRIDGVPVWENADLIARETEGSTYGVADALRFGEALTRRLEVSRENLLPAYNAQSDAIETATSEPAGYILPIRRRQPHGQLRWSSQLWFPRPERLELMAGDSPIGFRIPTEVMPWVAPDEIEYEYDSAPFSDKVKLPSTAARRPDLFEVEPDSDPLPPLSASAATATVLIRTALCVQARQGRIHVFLPFASELADYLDLVSAVEDTCAYLRMKVCIEGYTPPADPRLRFFSVTPDPGVLEINLPPARNWDELEALNTVLFEEARKNRLTAEKFNFDGSHAATGGGSHIVVGGATMLDSPFLRRPDLLRSMVAFWQNHPSLSYLFSGMYVGPTSQYPRIDEARLDTLYEMEVAFANLPKSDCPPWIVDGLFRNLLIDVTGNSHRAEFCIDKLFPPEGLGLRLGLLELRAFEMAPHLRMSLLQSLLIRALISMFWRTPFEGGLIRWGTALHDRFMLPHFVQRDLYEVLAHLRQAGFDFGERWFAAQLEFRFPKIGSISAEGVELELRKALEPWNVLAEETVSGRTVRSVDSSMERMQVMVSGLSVESRYVVTCNGRRMPLASAEGPGVMLAGIRYRARQLSASLHPTIPVHAPLVFELIDTWRERSIGQCTYHVGAPDSRVYEGRPATAAEAEERRRERFQVTSLTPGCVAAPREELNPSFPMTLDLRLPKPAQTTRPESEGLTR
ncbi:transglutaminase family protein [Acidicapsa acidisoli]|uniref:transglutaminase family protein n=1 Tax=Acidicapsa acidisoli TaxID=1615681 RepID=UPI0021DFB64C|nr:transglutaminase family protein [Acidicapsa acidisoli]